MSNGNNGMQINNKHSNLQIRPATNADSPAIKHLVFAVLEEFGLKPDSAVTDNDLQNIEQTYHYNNGYFGVVESTGEIIATLGISRVDDQVCELRKMYMVPHARGKGMGKQLLEFALNKARDMGYKRVVLETATPLKTAIALYRKFGFKEYQPDHLSCRCDQAFELDL